MCGLLVYINCTALHYMALVLSALPCTALHFTALYCSELYCTILHYTARQYTALSCTNHTLLDWSETTGWGINGHGQNSYFAGTVIALGQQKLITSHIHPCGKWTLVSETVYGLFSCNLTYSKASLYKKYQQIIKTLFFFFRVWIDILKVCTFVCSIKTFTN